MARYHLNREQATKAKKIINEDPNPLTDINMLNTLKDYYKTNSNYQAELHWMVERGIIDENDHQIRFYKLVVVDRKFSPLKNINEYQILADYDILITTKLDNRQNEK